MVIQLKKFDVFEESFCKGVARPPLSFFLPFLPTLYHLVSSSNTHALSVYERFLREFAQALSLSPSHCSQCFPRGLDHAVFHFFLNIERVVNLLRSRVFRVVNHRLQ